MWVCMLRPYVDRIISVRASARAHMKISVMVGTTMHTPACRLSGGNGRGREDMRKHCTRLYPGRATTLGTLHFR